MQTTKIKKGLYIATHANKTFIIEYDDSDNGWRTYSLDMFPEGDNDWRPTLKDSKDVAEKRADWYARLEQRNARHQYRVDTLADLRHNRQTCMHWNYPSVIIDLFDTAIAELEQQLAESEVD